MKGFSIEALALAALLAGCGKEGDTSCKEGEYLVNAGLSCCPVGTEFKAGLCVKPSTGINTPLASGQCGQGTIERDGVCMAESTPTTENQGNATSAGPPDISGEWLLESTIIMSDGCAGEVGERLSAVITVTSLGNNYFNMGFGNLSARSTPGCTLSSKAEAGEAVGKVTAGGLISASASADWTCRATNDSDVAWYLNTGQTSGAPEPQESMRDSLSGRVEGSTISGSESILREMTVGGYSYASCRINRSFTATR